MELRTRLVIPTDGSKREPLPSPQFDSAAANSARPVRPITESEETVVRQRPVYPSPPAYPTPPVYPAPSYYVPTPAPYAYQTAGAPYAPKKRSAWRSFLVAILITGAVGFGLTLGYGVAHFSEYRSVQPIVAAAAFRDRESLPDPEFTLPPEEEPEDIDLEGTGAEVSVPDEPPVDDEDAPMPVREPRRTRGTDPGNQPQTRPLEPARDPDQPSDNSGDVRQRRAQQSDPRKNPSDRNQQPQPRAQNRRSRNSIITRIREIFEGKP
jgi:hypothetical protein